VYGLKFITASRKRIGRIRRKVALVVSTSGSSATQKMMRKALEGRGNTSALRPCKGLLSMAIITALAVASAEAQQVPDDGYNPPIEIPAYPEKWRAGGGDR
jgi:hypothetical protein